MELNHIYEHRVFTLVHHFKTLYAHEIGNDQPNIKLLQIFIMDIGGKMNY